MNHEWEKDAVCATVDPELWFPDAANEWSPALKICNGCPVQRECLKESFDARMEFGIWAGVGAKRRLSLLRTYVSRSQDQRVKMLDRIIDGLHADQVARDDQLVASRERLAERKRLLRAG